MSGDLLSSKYHLLHEIDIVHVNYICLAALDVVGKYVLILGPHKNDKQEKLKCISHLFMNKANTCGHFFRLKKYWLSILESEKEKHKME